MKKAIDLLRLFNIKAKKEYGQNFLIDENALDDIVDHAEITKKDLVIEIGPGIGSLTQRLCKKAAYVVSFEIDKSMRKPLEYVLNPYNNHSVVYENILEINDLALSIDDYISPDIENIKVVANLPYYIATAVITKLLSENSCFSKMVLMVQKEVAERICHEPGSKKYGVLSIAVQVYSKAYILRDILRDAFIPSPNVDSSVVILDVYKEIPYNIDDINFFFKIVKAAFSQRRKTVVNSLHAGFSKNISKEVIKKILVELGEDERIRAEGLSIENFCKLTEILSSFF